MIRKIRSLAELRPLEFKPSCGTAGYWKKFDKDDTSTYPKKYGKYFVCRKDGKIHWETWNSTSWAYNANSIEYYAEIIKPSEKSNIVIY